MMFGGSVTYCSDVPPLRVTTPPDCVPPTIVPWAVPTESIAMVSVPLNE